MADPNHPRKFTEEFRRQIVQLYLAGKPRRELMAEYDLVSSTLSRWIRCYCSNRDSPCWNSALLSERVVELACLGVLFGAGEADFEFAAFS